MATSTVQSATDMVKKFVKKAGVATPKAKRGRPVGGKKRNGETETVTAQLYRQGKDAVAGAYETAAKAGRALPSTRQIRDQGQSVYSMMEERPLVMGAVGLGVGIALAALLPSMSHKRSRTKK
jgi:hypothetical protein